MMILLHSILSKCLNRCSPQKYILKDCSQAKITDLFFWKSIKNIFDQEIFCYNGQNWSVASLAQIYDKLAFRLARIRLILEKTVFAPRRQIDNQLGDAGSASYMPHFLYIRTKQLHVTFDGVF